MAGLILKLRPFEEVLINGVILENGDRKTRLRVKTEGAKILRLRSALRAEEATTPIARAAYVAQLGVSGDLPVAEALSILTETLPTLLSDAPAPEKCAIKEAIKAVAEGQIYGALRELTAVIRPTEPAGS